MFVKLWRASACVSAHRREMNRFCCPRAARIIKSITVNTNTAESFHVGAAPRHALLPRSHLTPSGRVQKIIPSNLRLLKTNPECADDYKADADGNLLSICRETMSFCTTWRSPCVQVVRLSVGEQDRKLNVRTVTAELQSCRTSSRGSAVFKPHL